MLMAHDDVNFWSNEDFTMVDDDRLSIDLDILYSILTEDPDQFHHQKNPEGDFSYDVGDHHNSEVKKGFQEFKGTPSLGAESSGPFPSFSRHTEASISRTGGSKVLSECSGNVGCNKQFSAPNSSPVRSCSKGLKNLTTLVSGNDFCKETDRVSRDALPPYRVDSVEMLHEPKCDTAFSSAAASDNYILGYPFDMCIQQLEEGTGFQMNVGGDMDNRDNSQSETMEKIDLNLEDYGFFTEDSMQTLAAPEKDPCVLVGIPPHSATYTDYNTCQVSDMTFETSEPYSFSQNQVTTKSTVIFPDSLRKPFSDRSKFHFMPSIEKTTSDIKDEKEEVTDENAFLSSKTAEDQVGHANDDGQYNLTSAGNSFSDISNRFYVDAPSTQPMVGTVPYIPSLKKKLTDYGHLVPCQLSSIKRHMAQKKVEKQGVPAPEMAFSPQPQVICDGVTSLTHDVCLGGHALEHSALCNNQLDAMDGKDTKLFQPRSAGSFSSDVNPESVQSNFSNHKYHCSDDNDVCILEDMCMPSSSSPSLIHGKLTMSSERSISSDSLLYLGSEGVKFKENDERFIFRAVLQDLSQPKSEVSLPHGVLAVPLLRHQRIALSWMVQKETASIHCSGGILADDQGLGKTISTIALILKERSPSSKANQMDMELGIHETLNLDDDDSGSEMSEVGGMKSRHVPVQPKGRPAAGTLVVCPTSVLRQWAEELHNKVTRKANLSVLVYHGSSRTKDPCELAKYDVVLTTYSIVSMEVPKQPLADEECDENEKHKAHDQPVGLCSSKKRKHPLSSAKRSLTTKKEIECASLEPVARPLARVGWFRVVLDEAQSIKNHRTQVARACWGLRAKRRWCLSGTPIQNTVDDLYSYFRFLRYEPYAAFKSFCYTIKNPISRNPAGGYRKLQAVLKTIMLRRTKGTLLDGEPIVTLPPKSVKLKKVNFSKEERDFYMRLEADSRAQFEVYAAEGTVKQNYVNILLMLLRLRQACDHPLLVRGYDSNSVWRSSVETAKKLPRDKKFFLLNCLEASLALCGICNDPPEDAVVSLCGHVFCNQCICEHLTGDDSKCAVTSCKVQLNILSVFSKGTLNNALSDQSVHDTSDSPGSEVVDPHPVGQSCGSSKIRAAIEVLQLLSKPKEFITRHGSPPISHRREVANDMPSKRSSSKERRSSDLFRVTGEKAIVFSQWTRMLDLLEASLRNSSIQFRRLDGTMTVAARDKAVRDFNTRPEVSVMIMSLKAASLGLNMVAACHVLLLDLWWNPTTEDQAIDRAHRIGQTRPVTVLRLTVKDTVEDRILALQQKKREMVASAFGEDDETGSRQTRLTVEDLKYLFMV